MKFFTADTHMNHSNIIKYCNRPFQTVEEMNETIINNWNSVVKDNDEVYHLGDFVLTKDRFAMKNFRGKLNGGIILIKGNHDRLNREDYQLFNKVAELMEIRYNGQKITLCHYAMRTWNCSHHGSLHFYGHSHGTLPIFRNSLDVGVDANDFRPLSIDEAIKKIEQNNKKLIQTL